MTRKKKIRVSVEKTSTGYSAFATDIPVFTTGNTITKLLDNIIEAINLHLEDDNRIVKPENIKLEIDLKQFFKYYRVINAKFLAERIGMNPALLSQYVQGKKIPSEQQTNKILKGINEIGKELSELSFTYK